MTLAATTAPAFVAATARASERTVSGVSSRVSCHVPARRRATKPRDSRAAVAVWVPTIPEVAVLADGDGARQRRCVRRPGQRDARPGTAVPAQGDDLVPVGAAGHQVAHGDTVPAGTEAHVSQHGLALR